MSSIAMAKKKSAVKKAAKENVKEPESGEDTIELEEKSTAQDEKQAKKKRTKLPIKQKKENKRKREKEARAQEIAKLNEEAKQEELYLDRRLFVGNLHSETTVEDLRELFAKFGVVRSAKLHVDNKGLFRGVGFVTFETDAEVEQALQLNGVEHKKQALRVAKAMPPKQKKETEVFVGGIPIKTEETKLRKHFKSCGEIKKVMMVIDFKKKKFNGTAFIRFKTGEAALKALKFHDTDFAGRTLSVRLALPKRKVQKQDTIKDSAAKAQTTESGGEVNKSKKVEKAESTPSTGVVQSAGTSVAQPQGEKRKAGGEVDEPSEKKKKKKIVKKKA